MGPGAGGRGCARGIGPGNVLFRVGAGRAARRTYGLSSSPSPPPLPPLAPNCHRTPPIAPAPPRERTTVEGPPERVCVAWAVKWVRVRGLDWCAWVGWADVRRRGWFGISGVFPPGAEWMRVGEGEWVSVAAGALAGTSVSLEPRHLSLPLSCGNEVSHSTPDPPPRPPPPPVLPAPGHANAPRCPPRPPASAPDHNLSVYLGATHPHQDWCLSFESWCENWSQSPCGVRSLELRGVLRAKPAFRAGAGGPSAASSYETRRARGGGNAVAITIAIAIALTSTQGGMLPTSRPSRASQPHRGSLAGTSETRRCARDMVRAWVHDLGVCAWLGPVCVVKHQRRPPARREVDESERARTSGFLLRQELFLSLRPRHPSLPVSRGRYRLAREDSAFCEMEATAPASC
ncbi:hypothetical protein BV22DRAFT_837175 [Leucogyrophana mollusca]|uniref:Uncharacterized protein n=1 Tax=Leucogyrophana mollusca TaxID=85980 RepID=A0ACB8B4B4_9AGAM|nr:hypothetical protein BV22DRAFT_837175 [Leucogyrophana mollusca]